MAAWCVAQNAKLGEDIYHVIDWPPVGQSEPQIVAEDQLVVSAPKPAPKRKSAVESPSEAKKPDTGLSFIEQVVAERTLGLDTSNAVSRNEFKVLSDTDQKVAARLVERGLMGQKGSEFYLTVAGFAALSEKRKLQFGVVG